MFTHEAFEPFEKYLNAPGENSDDRRPCEEWGLIPNAPESAIKAYEEYKEICREMKEQGYE